MPIQITHVDKVHDGFGRYYVATVQLPNGRASKREIEDHGPAVCVLAFDAVRRTAILVRQLRAPVLFAAGQDDLLEAIAGLVEGPDHEEDARREAMEEAGLKLGALDHVVTGWTMPGISTERMDFYFAPYGEADRVGAGGGLAGENESTAVIEMPLAELAAMADDGRLTDIKTLFLVQTLRLRRPELFGS